jgi:Flp pilus assembly protein TadG
MLEFALLSPLLIFLLVGTLQVGIMLQSYSALHHVTADVARHAMVQYATGNHLDDTELTLFARGKATAPPYMLTSTLVVTVTDTATPQIAGTTEKALTITYQIPSLLSSMGLNGPSITDARPLFLTTPGAT